MRALFRKLNPNNDTFSRVAISIPVSGIKRASQGG
jgi:hypothetical protein